jgi:hypothetical protein
VQPGRCRRERRCDTCVHVGCWQSMPLLDDPPAVQEAQLGVRGRPARDSVAQRDRRWSRVESCRPVFDHTAVVSSCSFADVDQRARLIVCLDLDHTMVLVRYICPMCVTNRIIRPNIVANAFSRRILPDHWLYDVPLISMRTHAWTVQNPVLSAGGDHGAPSLFICSSSSSPASRVSF